MMKYGGISLSAILLVYTGISSVTGALNNECRGEGLVANYTSECQDYFKCQEGAVTGYYSCPEGSTFSSAARQCLPKGSTPCVQHFCHSEDTLFYAAPGTQCHFYYKCEKGTAIELACPGGSWFNFTKQECTRSGGVCYEPVCTGLTDGKYPDSTQTCQRFLLCSGGKLKAVESPGTISTGKCPSPRTTAVAFPFASSDRCWALPDGTHPIPGVNCRDYILCKDGETQGTLQCPLSMRFDGQKCSPEDVTPCVDECTALADGFHVDLASGCREYVYCQNHSSLLRTACFDGTIFDGQMCVSPAFYSCPVMLRENPCLNRRDGYHRDPKDCRIFYYCSSGEVMLKDFCHESQVWNGTTCVSKEEFRCEGPVLWSGCTQRSSGYHQDRSRGSDCKNYYHCWKDMRIDFSCPSNQIFNGEQCVHEGLYTCPSLEKDSCDFKGDGFYQQTSGGCRGYYMCSGGNKIIYLCDIGQAFDGEKCVDKDSYKCPYHSDDCEGKSNGYHQDVKTNCRKYFFCDSDEKLTTLQCSGSKIFNGQGCVNPKEYQCPNSKSGNVCAYKPDGYYVKDATKCRQYFKCTNYKVSSYHTCPTNKIFDGLNTCIEKNCSTNAITCERNGFFLDLPSRCRSYHLCIEKRKTTLECDANKVFNGQLCVPQDTFSCPDECSQHHCHNII
ncbi:chitin-binding domain protein cbd-1-like [Arctopsyche grandis]|uniref:chitin-binding domain protein cbd-1-like n=1 Tax=Arctopsyche grandis TaxID=121162 RepID=UPI00406D8CCC